MRNKVIVGSLLGAVAIHGAFIACGMPSSQSGDGGPVGYLLEAMRDAAGLEVSDASAQDSGPACSCPVPPAPAESSFSLRVDKGMGPEEPLQDWSAAVVAARPDLQDDGTVRVDITSSAAFRMRDATRVNVSCRVYARPDRSLIQQDGPQQGQKNIGFCTIQYPGSNRESQLYLSQAEVITLTDHQVELRVPDQTAPLFSGNIPAGSVRITGIVFRSTNPSTHFLTPPQAYRP
jgi:hypothetical protein